MPGVGPGDLWDLANEYLEACVVALGATSAGPPDRVFVSPGVPPWDCPNQLTVHVGAPIVADTLPLVPALAPLHRTQVHEVDLIALTATVLRCAPLMTDFAEMPTPASIDTVSQQTYADLWAIWNYLKTAKRAATLFAPKEREFALDPAVPVAMGDTCGWQIGIRVQLDGFVATL